MRRRRLGGRLGEILLGLFELAPAQVHLPESVETGRVLRLELDALLERRDRRFGLTAVEPSPTEPVPCIGVLGIQRNGLFEFCRRLAEFAFLPKLPTLLSELLTPLDAGVFILRRAPSRPASKCRPTAMNRRPEVRRVSANRPTPP